MSTNTLLRFLVVALLTALPGGAYAHGPSTGTHGGQMADAGPYHVELAVVGDELLLYVTDDTSRPVAVNGAVAEATVVLERQTRKVVLSPSGANILAGRWSPAGAASELKAVVALTLPGKPPVMARFEGGH